MGYRLRLSIRVQPINPCTWSLHKLINFTFDFLSALPFRVANLLPPQKLRRSEGLLDVLIDAFDLPHVLCASIYHPKAAVPRNVHF